MVPTAIREDPLTQYLLGFALVIFLVGSVGGTAWTIHMSEPPTLAYVATILVPVLVLVAATALYHRLYLSTSPSQESEE